MLILFADDWNAVRIDAAATGRSCGFAQHVRAYTARAIEPLVRQAFEEHLIECGSCQRAVHLGRISTHLNHHNRSVGMPCAAQTRRIS